MTEADSESKETSKCWVGTSTSGRRIEREATKAGIVEATDTGRVGSTETKLHLLWYASVDPNRHPFVIKLYGYSRN
jgi:hypothetical protein